MEGAAATATATAAATAAAAAAAAAKARKPCGKLDGIHREPRNALERTRRRAGSAIANVHVGCHLAIAACRVGGRRRRRRRPGFLLGSGRGAFNRKAGEAIDEELIKGDVVALHVQPKQYQLARTLALARAVPSADGRPRGGAEADSAGVGGGHGGSRRGAGTPSPAWSAATEGGSCRLQVRWPARLSARSFADSGSRRPGCRQPARHPRASSLCDRTCRGEAVVLIAAEVMALGVVNVVDGGTEQ